MTKTKTKSKLIQDQHITGVVISKNVLLNELVIDGLLDEEPASGNAVLALVEEDAAQRVLHSLHDIALRQRCGDYLLLSLSFIS